MSAASRIESLNPVAGGERIFTLFSYVLMWWASLIVIQGFVLGQSLLPPQGNLSFVQGIMVVVLACLVTSVFMSLNGQAGLKHGIPYCIQARAAFGVRGSRFPELIRLVPALVWFGFGSWIAALAMDGIIQTLTGFSMPGIKFVYFLILQALQTWFAYRGIKAMKWFTVGASVALVLIMGQILFQALQSERFQLADTLNVEGDWGWPFWTGVNATIGILVAVMVSASDLTRYLENKPGSMWLGHLFGILPPLLFMMLLGFVASVTTGEWEPIRALMQLSTSPLLMLLMLFFILVAQFSTNLTVNILPPALIFEEIFGLKWKQSVFLVGVLGSLSFPWILLESGEKFVTFINYYTAFFGPLLGCMLAQSWLEPIKPQELYEQGASSPYWYVAGFNPAAVITTLLVSVVVMLYFLEVSWLVGLPMSLVSYAILDRTLIRFFNTE